MTNPARYDRKVEAALEGLRKARRQADHPLEDAPKLDPLLAYDLASLESHGLGGADTETERAAAWRRRIGVTVLVLLISGIAVLAAFSGPEPLAPAVPPFP